MRLTWEVKCHITSKVNMLAPTVLIMDNGEFFVFFGYREYENAIATIKAIKLEILSCPDQIRIDDTDIFQINQLRPDRFGAIPTFAYPKLGVFATLCVAKFYSGGNHKHRLLAEEWQLRYIPTRQVFELEAIDYLPFINYSNNDFHTFAGLSRQLNGYSFARGKDWVIDGSHKTPSTNIFQRGFSGEVELASKRSSQVIALTRPNIFTVKNIELLFYSVRDYGQKYYSEIVRLQDEENKLVQQEFIYRDCKLDNNVVVYQVPFAFNGQTWCIFATDYRGSEGFYIASLVNDGLE